MTTQPSDVFDKFLAEMKASRCAVTIFLASNVKLDGKIVDFDDYCIVIEGRDKRNVTALHAVASIVPRG